MRARNWIVIAAATSLPLIGTVAQATAQRTFVASNGGDTHPCSLAQPCRSFAAAITQTTPGGEVIVLDSAGYGTVTVTKSVSIISPAGIYAGISVFSGSDGVTINAPGAVVVLRGLLINGEGGAIGVNVAQAARVRIENCVISNMGSNGVASFASGSEMVIVDTIVRDNGGTGIGISADASVVLDRVRSEHNAFDGFYIANIATAATAAITDSVFAFNANNGVWADGVGSSTAIPDHLSIAVDRSTLASNGGDGLRANSSPSGVVANLTRNLIQHNTFEGIEVFTPAPDGIVYATIVDNSFAYNVDHGIQCSGPHAAITYIARNVFPYDQNFSVAQSGSCQIYSHQNNSGIASKTGAIGNAGTGW